MRPRSRSYGRDLDAHAVSGEHADAEAAHLAREVGEDGVPVLELDAEHGVRQRFDDFTVERDLLFNCYWRSPPLMWCPSRIVRRHASGEGTSLMDAVIVGGGHNGLVAAAYLARAGGRCSCSSGAARGRRRGGQRAAVRRARTRGCRATRTSSASCPSRSRATSASTSSCARAGSPRARRRTSSRRAGSPSPRRGTRSTR